MEALILATVDCEVRSVIKPIEIYRQLCQVYGQTRLKKSTRLLQEFGWEVFNHHPPYSPDHAPSDSDFHVFFFHLKKFLLVKQQRFQNDREAEMSVSVVTIPGSKLL